MQSLQEALADVLNASASPLVVRSVFKGLIGKTITILANQSYELWDYSGEFPRSAYKGKSQYILTTRVVGCKRAEFNDKTFDVQIMIAARYLGADEEIVSLNATNEGFKLKIKHVPDGHEAPVVKDVFLES